MSNIFKSLQKTPKEKISSQKCVKKFMEHDFSTVPSKTPKNPSEEKQRNEDGGSGHPLK